MRIVLYVLTTLLFSSHLNSAEWTQTKPEGAKATATLNADKPQLTDTLNLTLVIDVPSGYTVDAKKLGNQLVEYGEFVSRAWTILSEKTEQNGNTLTISYQISPKSPGKHYLTFHTIPLTPLDSKLPTLTIPSGIFAVDVQTMGSEELLPIAPLMPLQNALPLDLDEENMLEQQQRTAEEARQNQNVLLEHSFPWHYLVLYPLGLLALFGLARAAQQLIAYLQQPKPPISPIVEAHEKLERLQITPNTPFDTFYIELTQILRHFIEKHYQVPLNEMTTEEFMQQMTKAEAPFDLTTQQTLSDLLALADQVKFAKETPSEEQCKQALAHAQAFLQKNSPASM
jgi:hypothetical protein